MENTVTIHNKVFNKYIDSATIQTKLKRVACEINSDYKESDGLYVIGILTGAFMTISDLV